MKKNPNPRGHKETLRPPWKPGESGNPKGKPPGVKSWSAVMAEFFNLWRSSPETIEKLIKCKIPDALKNTDGQMLLIYRLVHQAVKGDVRAMAEIIDRMDGKANQPISGKSIVEIIKEGHQAAEEAKAEAEGK